ncbi:hypothetical protein ACW0US_17915 [Xanthomonas euvesicatoria]
MQSLPFFPVPNHSSGALVGVLATAAAVGKNPAAQQLELADLPAPPPSTHRPR